MAADEEEPGVRSDGGGAPGDRDRGGHSSVQHDRRGDAANAAGARSGALRRIEWTARRTGFHRSYNGSSKQNAAGERVAWSISYPVYQSLRDRTTSFSGLMTFGGWGRFNLTIRGRAELAGGELVSGNYFRSARYGCDRRQGADARGRPAGIGERGRAEPRVLGASVGQRSRSARPKHRCERSARHHRRRAAARNVRREPCAVPGSLPSDGAATVIDGGQRPARQAGPLGLRSDGTAEGRHRG